MSSNCSWTCWISVISLNKLSFFYQQRLIVVSVLVFLSNTIVSIISTNSSLPTHYISTSKLICTHIHPHSQADYPEQICAHLYKTLRICTLENHAHTLKPVPTGLFLTIQFLLKTCFMNNADFVDISTFQFVVRKQKAESIYVFYSAGCVNVIIWGFLKKISWNMGQKQKDVGICWCPAAISNYYNQKISLEY